MIRKRIRRTGVLVASVLAASLTFATSTGTAGAYDWWTYSDKRWSSGSIPYAIGNVSHFNGGGLAISTIQNGVQSWNGAGGSSIGFWYAGTDGSNWSGTPCDKGNYWIYQYDLSLIGWGGAAGLAWTCAYSGTAPYLVAVPFDRVA